MFETAVKHFIYDFCIGVIFDKIKYNLQCVSNKVPTAGDFLKRISHIYADEHYYDCIVKNVLKRTSKSGKDYFLVYVDYQYAQGTAVEEWEEEVNEYLVENDIQVDDNQKDDEYEVIDENIEGLMNDEEVEFMEYPDMICLNSLYYIFYR